MIYTSIGGVYVSIVTDKWQAKFSLLLSAISVVYVGLTFKFGDLPDLPKYLDINEAGIGSFVTLGFSLLAHGIFNDAYWQRVWSSQDEKSLKRGSWGAFFMILIVVFIFGFGGFLASWAGYVTEPDFAFFEIITSSNSGFKDFIMI
jgi:SSS family solute:Na+ symporter